MPQLPYLEHAECQGPRACRLFVFESSRVLGRCLLHEGTKSSWRARTALHFRTVDSFMCFTPRLELFLTTSHVQANQDARKNSAKLRTQMPKSEKYPDKLRSSSRAPAKAVALLRVAEGTRGRSRPTCRDSKRSMCAHTTVVRFMQVKQGDSLSRDTRTFPAPG